MSDILDTIDGALDDTRTCIEPDCGKAHYGRDRCKYHYNRAVAKGVISPRKAPARRAISDLTTTDIELFWSKVDRNGSGGCWNWLGALKWSGYGVFKIRGTTWTAHRVSKWLTHQFDITLDLDHLCRNRRCVNPDHLEPVTRKQNILRGVSPQAINARRTHCPRGHEYSEVNTHYYKGARVCRECKRIVLRASRARRRERRN